MSVHSSIMYKSLFFVVLWHHSFVYTVCIKNSASKYSEVIEINQGKLRGLETRRRDYIKYLGIPYATFVGRFLDPAPPPFWTDVFNATKGDIFCAQLHRNMGIPIGDEDCLTLNIFTPGQISHKKRIPVMVFIHGGGYMGGSSNELIYNPQPLVKKKVIVVIINYRVGAFGFLCLKIKGASGNTGLKDQLAALEWVKQNIKFFGGDPQSVTIFGQSAGASSVNHLLLSQEAKGLFHRAIMQSGTALSPFGYAHNPIERASLVASTMGHFTKNPYELLNIFTNATKTDIVMASIDNSSVDPMSYYLFRPCVERKIFGEKPFMTQSPKQILESKKYNMVPVIIGFNNMEGIFDATSFDEILYQELDLHFADSLPDNIYFNSSDQRTTNADAAREFYFGNMTLDQEAAGKLIDYFSDSLYIYPSVAVTQYLVQYSKYPVFNYYFQYGSNRNFAKIIFGAKDTGGASHGDELFFLFEPVGKYVVPKTKKDATFIDRITTMWSNFAKYGDPTSVKSAILGIKWVPTDNETFRFLMIDENLRMGTLPNPDRMEFWRNIYDD